MANSWKRLLLACIAVAEPSHGHLVDLFPFWIGSDHRESQSQGSAQLPTSHTNQLDSSPAQITPPPQELRRRQDANAQVTIVNGPYTLVEEVGSLCGYITQDVHAPLYCDEGLFCFTTDNFLQCCSSTVVSTTTTEYVYTMVTTGRDVGGTSTSLSTDDDPSPLTSTYGSSCATQTTTCYNYNDTASCTGSCTAGALLCTNSYFGFCASLYATASYSETASTGIVYKTSQAGVTYRCDTAEYGLQYYVGGYSPSVTSTFTAAATSSGVVFTPSVVPYSRTQASRPASSAEGVARATPTSSAGLSMLRDVPRSIVWTISFWLVMAFLNVLLYLFYEYLYSEKADR